MNIKYIGMDVHKETISIAVMTCDLGRREQSFRFTQPPQRGDRCSDRTMVGNSATRLACEFQRTEWRRHVSERETTGTKKHPRPVAPRPRGPLRTGTKRSSRCGTNVATGAGGWMSKKYSCRSGREKCFLLDIPFNRTSRPSSGTKR